MRAGTVRAPNGRVLKEYSLSDDGTHVVAGDESFKVYPKLSSTEYLYSINVTTGRRVSLGERRGATIRLLQTSSMKVKEFFIAGEIRDVLSLISHMNSLTDDLCSQFFNEREKKVKAKKESK
jgi:hypothetical protein